MPDTKPDLTFDDDGVCSACRAFEARGSVDWTARKAELLSILERYRNPSGHDCIIPVSGGKDSTFQALTIRDMGFNPLLVTATTDDPSDLGKRNLENLVSLGFDHVQVTVNPRLRHELNRLALKMVGDISWPEHVTIFTVPVRLSVMLGIPLIVWGENPQNEYGGPVAAQDSPHLTREWLEEFGGLLGMRVDDLPHSASQLAWYTYPTDEQLERAGTTGIFLGYYVPWDGYANALVSKANGFETYPHLVEGSLADYENLDNHATGVHDYLKYLKFNFGRTCDIVCNHIRRGRLTREQGLAIVEKLDGAYPETCLGKPLDDTLALIGMTRAEFDEVCEKFRAAH